MVKGMFGDIIAPSIHRFISMNIKPQFIVQ